ncbi:MAG: 23S rRNA (guanosine(2251)-2'-O)-methyltransferase RlmB [Cyanobacteriota bacterium]|nr:23S rRNA (guanosine(2251)-2'-O)-methyltransferase RlmB [Cyanobacteriota bacterium]
MGPSANDFSNRRRPGRRGDGAARGPGGGPPRDGARGRTGRGLNDPRGPGGSTFRRLGPRPEGAGAGGPGPGPGAAGAPGPSGYGSGYGSGSYGATAYGPRVGGSRPGGSRPGGPRPGSPRVGGPRTTGPRTTGPRTTGPRPNGPRPSGPGASGGGSFERRRWTRDRDDGSAGDTWRRPEGAGNRPGSPEDRDRPRWRLARRPDGPPSRPFRPGRPARDDGPSFDRDQPQGDAHAAAAPSELIWGRHAAQAALESERPIHRIWCTPEMRFRPTFLQLLREAKASGALVEEVTWARLGQISGGAVHQGIVLQPAAADTLDLGSLIDGCRNLGEAPLLVAVDGLTDPQNLGAILRSAEALGVHGLVLPQRRNAGLTGSVAKVAAGALEHLPVARVVNLNRALETLREEGYRVVGLDPRGSVSLEDADLEGPLVVITGSEGQGLSVLTRRSCDQLVRIPLRGTTPSLNASVATALVLYEVARRGWMRGLKGTAKPPRLVRPQMPTEALCGEPAVESVEAAEAAEARPAAAPVEAPVPPPAVSPDQLPELAADPPSALAPAQPLASAFPDEPVQPPTPDQSAEPALSEPAPQASAPPDLARSEVPAPPEPAEAEPTLSESPREAESSAAPPASPHPESPQPTAAQPTAAQPPVEAAPPAPPAAAPQASPGTPLETFATDISL